MSDTREIMDKLYAMTPGEVNHFLGDHIRDLISKQDNSPSNPVCPNGLEHGSCLFPHCVSSCPGRLSLAPEQDQ